MARKGSFLSRLQDGFKELEAEDEPAKKEIEEKKVKNLWKDRDWKTLNLLTIILLVYLLFNYPFVIVIMVFIGAVFANLCYMKATSINEEGVLPFIIGLIFSVFGWGLYLVYAYSRKKLAKS